MRSIDLLKEVYFALSVNKIRSGLTVLGIVIGITSVIIMLSIGEGVSRQLRAGIGELGADILTVIPAFIQPQAEGFNSRQPRRQIVRKELTDKDVEILKQIEGILYIAPELNNLFPVISPLTGHSTFSFVIGSVPEYALVRRVTMKAGSFFNESQFKNMARVAVIGSKVARDLFKETDPLGKTIRINQVNFKIIGVAQPTGGSIFFNPDESIYVPLTTMQNILTKTRSLSSITIRVKDEKLIPHIQRQITILLSASRRVDPKSPDFSVTLETDILKMVVQATRMLTIFLAMIASISLIVGGIGIMNMMLTTVIERTREIGLRKAIGAKKKDIAKQFLTEAVVLTLFGGVVGVILGWIFGLLVSRLAKLPIQMTLQTILLAFGICVAIGIIFGYSPARKAALLNPIDALRYE